MTQILGIVNITADSFSDGGAFLDPDAALAHAARLVSDGADILDIGPASSHPDAGSVSAEEEISRLAAVWEGLKALGVPLSVDSFQPETQKWAIAQGADWLNDINGFPDPAMYDALAEFDGTLAVMHAVQSKGIATRQAAPAGDIWEHILHFFEARLNALRQAGIAEARLVLDPGMGFFLGNKPEPSLAVLAGLERLKKAFGLPLLVCVSRKSFLRALVDVTVADSGPITLAAETMLLQQGVDYIRTHDAGQLKQAMRLDEAVRNRRPNNR